MILAHLCFGLITGHQFHDSLYEAGSFYKKHLDQFSNNDRRQYSMITYLNAKWQESDGGLLLVQHEKGVKRSRPRTAKPFSLRAASWCTWSY